MKATLSMQQFLVSLRGGLLAVLPLGHHLWLSAVAVSGLRAREETVKLSKETGRGAVDSAAGKTRSQFKNSCTASFRLLQKSPTPSEIPVLLLASSMWPLANLRPLAENHPKLHPAECMHENAGKFRNVEGFQTALFPHHEYLAQAKPDVTAGWVSAALRELFDKMWNFLQNRYCLGYYVPSLQNGSGEFSIQKTRGLFCLVSASAWRPASGWSFHVNQTALQILSKEKARNDQTDIFYNPRLLSQPQSCANHSLNCSRISWRTSK